MSTFKKKKKISSWGYLHPVANTVAVVTMLYTFLLLTVKALKFSLSASIVMGRKS